MSLKSSHEPADFVVCIELIEKKTVNSKRELVSKIPSNLTVNEFLIIKKLKTDQFDKTISYIIDSFDCLLPKPNKIKLCGIISLLYDYLKLKYNEQKSKFPLHTGRPSIIKLLLFYQNLIKKRYNSLIWIKI